MRPLEDLIDHIDPAWPLVLDIVRSARNPVEVLAGDPQRRAETLWRLQISTRSPMGAIAHETGGLLFDRGWVRLLGAGHARLPRDLATWNLGPLDHPNERIRGAFLIADDVVGGFFALNGGGLPGASRSVHYLAPDSLHWEDMGRGYLDFVTFLATGHLDRFYESQRWPGWAEGVSAMGGDRAFSIYPPLWAEGGPIASRSRRSVPVEEIWSLHHEFRRVAAKG